MSPHVLSVGMTRVMPSSSLIITTASGGIVGTCVVMNSNLPGLSFGISFILPLLVCSLPTIYAPCQPVLGSCRVASP